MTCVTHKTCLLFGGFHQKIRKKLSTWTYLLFLHIMGSSMNILIDKKLITNQCNHILILYFSQFLECVKIKSKNLLKCNG